jgi:zona occludens toxin (predicted ATPase)
MIPDKTHPPRVFIQKSYEDARESCWAPKVSFKRIEESDYELISKPEVEALLAEARARAWNEAVAQFKIFGTDGCITCEGGRVTLFVANRQCTQCAPASYERKKAAAQAAPVGEGE